MESESRSRISLPPRDTFAFAIVLPPINHIKKPSVPARWQRRLVVQVT
jgi:hypothetical protein